MDHNELYYWVNKVCFKHFLNKGLHKRLSGFEVAIIYFLINFRVSMTMELFKITIETSKLGATVYHISLYH